MPGMRRPSPLAEWSWRQVFFLFQEFRPVEIFWKQSPSPCCWFKNHHVFLFEMIFSWDHPTFSWTKKMEGTLALGAALVSLSQILNYKLTSSRRIIINNFCWWRFFSLQKRLARDNDKKCQSSVFFPSPFGDLYLFRPSNIAFWSIKNSRRGIFCWQKLRTFGEIPSWLLRYFW